MLIIHQIGQSREYDFSWDWLFYGSFCLDFIWGQFFGQYID